jgi:DNA repair protein RadC
MDKIQKIKDWAEDDRPREKAMTKGLSSLTDAELIAVLIGSGTVSLNAVEVARMILSDYKNNLDDLGRVSLKELKHYPGIGDVKALVIAAALELGRRRSHSKPEEKPKISSYIDVLNEVGFLRDLPHEEFWILLLNQGMRLIKKIKISSGGISATVVDPRMIFIHAIEHLATHIILVHNHPSGNLQASQQDKLLTQKLAEGAKLIDIRIVDHMIVSHEGHFSFADEGLL